MKLAAGKIVAVCLSARKGTRKKNVGRAYLKKAWGFKDDAHAGEWPRQVSLLAIESILRQRRLLKKRPGETECPSLQPGDFAENLTTEGIELHRLPVGTRLRVGEKAALEVTQIGKECHSGCEIRRLTGDCIMPREGIFARVIRGGWVRAGDSVAIQTPAAE